MKKYYLLLLYFFCVAMYGQITDLNKLSKGKFYSYDVIKDANNNIKGYFLLYEADKVAKEIYELEYVVLDENLTKVTNGFMTELKYESWLVDAENIKVRTSLYENKLLLQLTDQGGGDEFFKRYRLLDITKNELSKPFIFNRDSLRIDPVLDRKNKNWSKNESDKIAFYNGVGLIVNSEIDDKKIGATKRYLTHYDNNLKEMWRCTYDNISGKKGKKLEYINSDEDVIVLFNHFAKNNSFRDYLTDLSMLFIDAKKGVVLNEFNFPSVDKLSYRVVDCKITDDNIYVMGDYSKKSKTGHIDDTESLGLYRFIFNKKTAKLTDSDYLKWESLSTKLQINKKGYVKKEGYLYPHNMLIKSDGSIIVVAEAFLQGPVTTNNMYFLELDDKFAMKDIFTVEKFRNKFPNTLAHSTEIKKYGLFDFIDYQNLGDDEYLFFLNDNEKKSNKKRKSTLYGVVSYSDGKFKRQTLDLKTETSTIYAYNAKKGYLMLIEDFDEKNKSTEFRLEKINY